MFNFIVCNIPSKILRWDNTVIKNTSSRPGVTWTQLLWTFVVWGQQAFDPVQDVHGNVWSIVHINPIFLQDSNPNSPA